MSSTPVDRLRALIGDDTIKESNKTAAEGQESNRTKPDAAVERANAPRQERSERSNAALASPAQTGTSSNASGITLEEILDSKRNMKRSNAKVRGEVGPLGDYCPILAVSKFPYKFMDPKSETSEIVSKSFFANNRFWNNAWNVYYLQVPTSHSGKPLLLIPKAEAQDLLSLIANKSGIRLSLPSESSGLVVSFEKDGSPLPRYLGMSTCREDFYGLEGAAPTAQLDFQEQHDGTILATCDQRTFEDWAAKVERAIAATKNKAKASKEKRKQQRVQTKTDWSRQLRRAQRYLGLRAASNGSPGPSSPSPKVDQDKPGEQDLTASLGDAIDMSQAVSLPFDSEVVFLSIDVEVYERGHKQVTEVGLAVLDTKDLVGVAPGEDGKNWMAKVKGRHFWIKEYAHLQNTEFCPGCPDRYEKVFGVTESITTTEAVNHLEACFKDPMLAKPPSTLAQPVLEKQLHKDLGSVGRSELTEGNPSIKADDAGQPQSDKDEGLLREAEDLEKLRIDHGLQESSKESGDSKQLQQEHEIESSPKDSERSKNRQQQSSTSPDQDLLSATPRKVVVVGHDIIQDINWLKMINFDVTTATNVLEILDTAELHRAMKHEDNPPSVSTMLYNFGISGWNLHNAGNDAAYTLQAFLGIAARSITQGNERHFNATELITKAKQEAEERIKDNLEEWQLASDGENPDGGPPKSPTLRVSPKKEKRQRIQCGEVV